MQSDSGAYKQQNAAALARYKALMAEEDWTVSNTADNCVMSSKAISGEPINMFRATGHLKGRTAKQMSDLIKGFGEKEWKQVDSDVVEWQVVEQIPDGVIIYQQNKLPWPLWHRTTVYSQCYYEEEGKTYVVAISCEHPDKPDEPAKFVRATINISVFEFVDEEGGCQCTRLVHVNPAGNIPSSVVNSVASGLHRLPGKLQGMIN
eukprot:TRINITY_DN522_c0_g1_i1.p1 TRINITY_DN522_c0_g1~~TRINITY_DN522_c0_g1_i1.p1  ORF type:complete len:205 (-),score=27.54 TRINITY_DN522_c0_g1_i1:101-715(-)